MSNWKEATSAEHMAASVRNDRMALSTYLRLYKDAGIDALDLGLVVERVEQLERRLALYTTRVDHGAQ